MAARANPPPISSRDQLSSSFNQQQISAVCERFRRQLKTSTPGFLLGKFIDIFCDPEKAPIPVKSTVSGKIELGELSNLRNISIEQWQQIIDPKRVRPKLLKNLKIPYSRKKGAKDPEITPEVVEGLISFFERLKSFPSLLRRDLRQKFGADLHQTNRFWVVGSSEDDPAKLKGMFVHFATRPKMTAGGEQIRAPDLALYPTLESCLRAKRYQDRSSRKEIGTVLKVASKSMTLADRLWNFSNLAPDERETALDEILELIKEVADTNPILFCKKNTKQRIQSSEGALDKRGRLNSPATAMKLKGAADGSGARVADVHETLIRNNYDALKFEALSLISQKIMLTAYELLSAKGDSLQPMFNPRLNSEQRKRQLDGFFENIGLGQNTRVQFYFRPYSTFISQIEKIKNEMNLVAGSDDLSKGKELQNKLLSFLYCASILHPALAAARGELSKESLPQAKIKLFDYCALIKKALEDPINSLALQSIPELGTNAHNLSLNLDKKISDLKRLAARVDIERLIF